MKKRICTILFIAFCFGKIYAQNANAKPEELKEMFNKTLAVELLEENPKYVEKITGSKKEEDQTELKNYKNFIKSYNLNIKKVVDNLWKLNKKIEYKTTSEIETIRKSKSPKYVCLFFSQSKHLRDPDQTFEELDIATLNYSRAEKKVYNSDYSFFFPSRIEVKNDVYNDLVFSINFMQKNINEIVSSGDKKNAKVFIQDQTKKNCGQLNTKTLLVDKTLFDEKKFDESEVKKSYSFDLNIGTAEDTESKLSKDPKKYLFLVAIPYGILKKTGGFLSVERIQFQRCIADLEGNIYGAVGAGFGQFYVSTFRAKDLKTCSDCK